MTVQRKVGASAKSRRPIRSSREISAVDLFCGVGGLTHGLVQGGISVAAGIDIDGDCRFPYEANNEARFLEKDIKSLTAKDIVPLFEKGKIRLLAGCAPCQPFSTYSQPGRSSRTDGKWTLLEDFGRTIEEIQPELVTMENVPRLLEHRVFKRFLKSLAGYHVWHGVVHCAEYGVPQSRKRLVLLASRLGSVELIAPTHADRALTLREAIATLPAIPAGGSHPEDPLHTACNLNAINMRRIKASRPGGTWRDWPIGLLSHCHRKESGKTYPSVYGRMEWEEPSPTITTQCFGFGNGRFGHPEQDRAISLREAAIIQTFPEQYKFVPEGAQIRFSVLGRLIGNAVPVRVGEVVAESLVRHVAAVLQ